MVIYKITNLVSNKIYIGQTRKTANKRFREHIRAAIANDDSHGGSVPLCKAIRKYGDSAFTVEVIDKADSVDELSLKEKYWITKLNTTNSNIGYNIQEGGISGKKPKETREKIGLKKKENWQNPDQVIRMLNGLRKGTVAWKAKCAQQRVIFKCPVCEKTLMLMACDAKARQFCSRSCAAKYTNHKRTGYHIKEPQSYNIIREKTHIWCKQNREIIARTPFNKIAVELEPIMLIANTYGIRTWRTLSRLLCGSSSRKELLTYLKRKYMLDQSE